MTSDLLYKEGFLSSEECDYLVWMAECENTWDSIPGHFLDGRAIEFFTTLQHRRYSSPLLQRLSMQIYRKKQELISKFVGHEVNVDFMALMRIEPGVGQDLHLLDAPEMERIAWGSVFLNDDFDGGISMYPNRGESIKPKLGAMYASGVGEKHAHAITPVSGKTRYTIVSTWTTKPLSNPYFERINKLRDYISMCDQAEKPVDI